MEGVVASRARAGAGRPAVRIREFRGRAGPCEHAVAPTARFSTSVIWPCRRLEVCGAGSGKARLADWSCGLKTAALVDDKEDEAWVDREDEADDCAEVEAEMEAISRSVGREGGGMEKEGTPSQVPV